MGVLKLKEKYCIDDWRNKRGCDQQAVLKDSSWHLVNPRSLIGGHCVYEVHELFTINIIKCKLLISRKTFRSTSVFMKNEVVLFSKRFNFRICRFSDWCKKVVKIIRHGLVIFAMYFWGDRSLRETRANGLPNTICISWIVLNLILDNSLSAALINFLTWCLRFL